MINHGMSIATIHDERGRVISVESVFNTISCDCPDCKACITIELHGDLCLEIAKRGWRDIGGLHFCPKHLTSAKKDDRLDT